MGSGPSKRRAVEPLHVQQLPPPQQPQWQQQQQEQQQQQQYRPPPVEQSVYKPPVEETKSPMAAALRRMSGVGPSSAASALTPIMAKLSLEQYAPALIKDGWDDPPQLHALGAPRLHEIARAVGMKPGHAHKFADFFCPPRTSGGANAPSCAPPNGAPPIRAARLSREDSMGGVTTSGLECIPLDESWQARARSPAPGAPTASFRLSARVRCDGACATGRRARAVQTACRGRRHRWLRPRGASR